MAQFEFGPIYCETPASSVGAVFPIEPANTVSNAVIVMFGLLALYFVIKRTPRAYDLYFLCALLIANGIGSGLWHGLRDRGALIFEVQAGLFVLFGIAFCWSRRLWSYAGAAAFLLAFLVGFRLSQELLGSAPRWVAIAPLVIFAGSVLATQTAFRSKKAAMLGDPSRYTDDGIVETAAVPARKKKAPPSNPTTSPASPTNTSVSRKTFRSVSAASPI